MVHNPDGPFLRDRIVHMLKVCFPSVFEVEVLQDSDEAANDPSELELHGEEHQVLAVGQSITVVYDKVILALGALNGRVENVGQFLDHFDGELGRIFHEVSEKAEVDNWTFAEDQIGPSVQDIIVSKHLKGSC